MNLRHSQLHIICLFFILLFTNVALAQSRDKVPEQVLPKSILTELQDEKPYSDYLEISDSGNNSLSRLRKMIAWFFSKLFENKVSYTFSNVIPYIIVVVMVVLIVLKLTGLSVSHLIKPSSVKLNEQGYYNEDELIQKADFNKLIGEAVEKGDYRIAIRYSYLMLLQQLDIKGYIQWEKQKSNFDYLLAVQNNTFSKEFTLVTQVYENAWYGEMPWSDNEYKTHFDEMLEQATTINKAIV